MKNVKKVILSAGLILSLFVCSACGQKDIDTAPSEMVTGVIANSGLEFPEMMDVTADKVPFYYNIQTEWYSDFSAKVSGAPAEADEVIVFKAASKDTVDEIETALNDRLESRKKDFEGYAPEEYDKLNASSVEVNGIYVSLIITDDNSAATKVYEEYFK